MWVHYTLIVLAVLSAVNSENSTLEDTCEAWDTGSFGALLEDWATEPASQRQGRVMALPSTKGYYVTERIDSPLVPPPPPHPAGPNRAIPLQGPAHYGSAPPQGYSGPHGYNEWDGNGKIVNKPPSPYKDKFRPSYQQQQQQQGPGRPQAPNSIDRVDEPPRKQVTETDLYLLSAIEKLVYRADLMEKRLRKLEESLHYVIAGAEAKPEPCMTNYTRVGTGCYQWSREAADWKGASIACRHQRAALLELDHAAKRAMVSRILSDKQLKGKDFWTGGLNPGLLWIWSHSARPVEAATNTTTIAGEGRCLALVYDPAINNYVYRGQDCALKHRYVCQKEEDKTKLSNEIERAARKLNLDRTRKAKLLWDSTDD